jgi:hypothetical protein
MLDSNLKGSDPFRSGGEVERDLASMPALIAGHDLAG